MLGWFTGIPLLTSILPTWVTMKFSTALCFFLSGAILYFVAETQRGKKSLSQIVLPICSLIIILLMATLLISVIIGVKSGIEDLFVQESAGAVHTTVPGRPSVGTMINFLLVAITALLSILSFTHLRTYVMWLGACILTIGMVATLGYMIDVSSLYYNLERVSTAMAFHTAILFDLLGVGFYLIGAAEEKGS